MIFCGEGGNEFTNAYSKGRQAPSGSHLFDQACKQLGIRHKLTRPYRPQTNGMVERIIGKIEQHVTKQN